MASGKSLEMKQFDEEHSLAKRRQTMCIAPGCGKPWSEHMDKKGTRRLKKYDNDKHYVNGTYVKKP